MTPAGGNPDEIRLAPFREHGGANRETTEHNEAILARAVHGVPFPFVAEPKSTTVNPATMIIGGGAGIQAALEIAAEPRTTFRSNGALRQFGSGPSPKPLSCDSTSPVIPTIALTAMDR